MKQKTNQNKKTGNDEKRNQFDKQLMTQEEKRAQETKEKKNFFLVELYDDVNGLMSEPEIFLAQKITDRNTKADLLIPEDDIHPVIPYPKKTKISLQNEYPNLDAVNAKITDVRIQLEEFDYKSSEDKNEIDLENELLDLERLRHLYVYGEKHELVSMRNGFKVLKFYKDGSIYLPLASSIEARGFAIPSNMEIKQHASINLEIDAEYVTKDKFSWINATNVLVLVLVVAIGLAIFGAYKYHASLGEVEDRIETYEEKYLGCIEDRSEQVTIFGNKLITAASICQDKNPNETKNKPPTYK